MNQNKVRGLISLAMKAGKAASGEYQAEQAVKGMKAFFVIVAEDASGNTKSKFENMCRFYETPFCFFGTKEELGRMIGKEERAIIAITEEGFAKGIQKHLSRSDV